jgi:PTS system N-acetylgalactosamine-specific IIA component
MSEKRAIVAGHADFSDGIISAVAQIAGRESAFIAMSNRGLSARDVEAKMRDVAREPNVTTIFTDLPAGSCTMAARKLLRERPELVLVTGANLASLLEFVFTDDMTALEAARYAAERGRSALAAVAGAVPGDARRGD